MIRKIGKILLRALAAFFILSILSTLLFRFIPVPVTPLMLIRAMEREDGRMDYEWVPIETISKQLPKAVIAAEDQKFESHNGFDLEAIEKAMRYNEKHKGKRVKGASTISQQTAKNLFLWPGRSWIRKGLEVYFTFLIELLWSKERIMEVYLNIIEFGPGVYGAEAAAHYHFDKTAQKLNKREAASLAAVLPNPIRWSASKPTSYIQRKRNRIMILMDRIDRQEKNAE
jgi:monofunctional biosynthetic peptidoglycan transglycosylase